VLLTGAVASVMAVPVSNAATGNLVQIDGKLVAPAQLSETQLAAGQAPSTLLVQIGGKLVEPAQLSTWQSGAGLAVSPPAANDNSSFGLRSALIATAAALSFVVLLAFSTLTLRRKRRLATA